jgi:hypothetical protein
MRFWAASMGRRGLPGGPIDDQKGGGWARACTAEARGLRGPTTASGDGVIDPPRRSNRTVLLALLGLMAVLFVASYCFIWRPHSNPLPGQSGSATGSEGSIGLGSSDLRSLTVEHDGL